MYVKQIRKILGPHIQHGEEGPVVFRHTSIASDFTGVEKDDPARVRLKLDESDKICDRDNGHSVMSIQDVVRCTAKFESVEAITDGYYALIHGRHSDYITKIAADLGKDGLKITINMGVETNDKEAPFIPLIGEVQLVHNFED